MGLGEDGPTVFLPFWPGGDQEKIPDTYDGVGGCPEHRILGFFPTYFGIFSEEKSLLFEQFQPFFCIFVSTLHFFAKIRCQFHIWEWYIEKSRPKFGGSNFSD